ncbi:MAG: dephospho-CoA kinase [Saprospiraceae bacterium]
MNLEKVDNQQSTITNQILRVGITGGIGSGKSTVCRIFHEALGIPIFYADIWAKQLLNYDPELQAGIVGIFGPEAYSPEGLYDRPYVAKIAFTEPAKLAALNALVHPAVEAESLDWHEFQAELGCPYTLKEAALMVESGSHQYLDFLIVVTAPEDLRIQRVMERDGLAEEQVRARMRGQLPEADKLKLADFVIVNDGSQMLLPQVWAAHQAILNRKM